MFVPFFFSFYSQGLPVVTAKRALMSFSTREASKRSWEVAVCSRHSRRYEIAEGQDFNFNLDLGAGGRYPALIALVRQP
jgi:hypothetical protein